MRCARCDLTPGIILAALGNLEPRCASETGPHGNAFPTYTLYLGLVDMLHVALSLKIYFFLRSTKDIPRPPASPDPDVQAEFHVRVLSNNPSQQLWRHRHHASKSMTPLVPMQKAAAAGLTSLYCLKRAFYQYFRWAYCSSLYLFGSHTSFEEPSKSIRVLG